MFGMNGILPGFSFPFHFLWREQLPIFRTQNLLDTHLLAVALCCLLIEDFGQQVSDAIFPRDPTQNQMT